MRDELERLGVRTFGELRRSDPGADENLAPHRRYRLVVIASDVTHGRLLRLPWNYEMLGLDPHEQLVADADPIEIFDRTDLRSPRWPTLGVKIVAELSAGAAEVFPGVALPALRPVRLLERVLATAIVGHGGHRQRHGRGRALPADMGLGRVLARVRAGGLGVARRQARGRRAAPRMCGTAGSGRAGA